MLALNTKHDLELLSQDKAKMSYQKYLILANYLSWTKQCTVSVKLDSKAD